jgi:uncharacterized protein YndB with AHSA1/START domain
MTTEHTTEPSTDRMERQIVLDAPRERVWRALTDVGEFSRWFGVRFETPFAPGAEVAGALTSPRYAHVTLRVWIETMDAPDRFAFRWHPHALDPDVDYSKEPTTLVTFTLESVDGGTLLRVVETGFDAIPESRRALALMAVTNGWAAQLKNVARHLEAQAA